MVFEDIYEMLESLRGYRLRAKECLIQVGSCDGLTFGYYTADSEFRSVSWTISLRSAKETALARGTKEAHHIRELLSSFMGRYQLLQELREGTLEYGIAKPSRLVPALPKEHLASPTGECYQARILPKQCSIPGL